MRPPGAERAGAAGSGDSFRPPDFISAIISSRVIDFCGRWAFGPVGGVTVRAGPPGRIVAGPGAATGGSGRLDPRGASRSLRPASPPDSSPGRRGGAERAPPDGPMPGRLPGAVRMPPGDMYWSRLIGWNDWPPGAWWPSRGSGREGAPPPPGRGPPVPCRV